VGSDKIQLDSGLLVLRVNPAAQEGTETARIMDADPGSPNLTRPTFRLDQEKRNLFLDKENNVAVVPLWEQGENLGVMVTTAEKGRDAVKAAQMILQLWQKYPEPRDQKVKPIVEECLAAFKSFDFQKSYQIARKAL
jgi:hypothetical protein